MIKEITQPNMSIYASLLIKDFSQLTKMQSATLILITTLITSSIKLVLPVILAYVAYRAYLVNGATPITTTLLLLAPIELIFYLYCSYLHVKLTQSKVQNNLSDEQRLELAAQIMRHPVDDVSGLFSKWFLPRSGNFLDLSSIKIWLMWAFFNKSPEQMSKSNLKVLDQISDLILKELPLPEQLDDEDVEKFKCMRLSLDPINYEHKPLLIYSAIFIIQATGNLFLTCLGFKRSQTNSGSMGYWVYEPSLNDQNLSPIFFIHGIGIGLTMYSKVIHNIQNKHPNRKIILLELPYISLTPTTHIPDMPTTLSAIDEIHHQHNLGPCSYLSHSYGTIISAWIIKHRPQHVHKVSLIDPVCFQMWDPSLIYNFLYSPPISFVQALAHFFIAQDLFLANTLYRNFIWYDNLLFIDQINTADCHIYVSTHDWIVDGNAIVDHIQTSHSKNPTTKLNLVKLDGLSHGEFLLRPDHGDTIVSHL